MQATRKKCHALAIAALTALSATGLAHAGNSPNESIVLYGLIDLGLAFERQNGDSHIGMRDGTRLGSRWGLRGSEDLGNGYRAVFRLESGFHANNGAQGQGRLFGRWAYLGLAGDFGEVRFGRQQLLSFSWGAVASPFGTSWGGASAGTTLGFNDGNFGNGPRFNNGIIYRTPTANGWQAGLGYSFDADDNNKFKTADHNRVWTAALRYSGGPFSTALTFEHLNPDSSVAGLKKTTNVQWGAAYDFEWIKVHGGYGYLRNPNVGPSAGYRKINSFLGGASVPVSTHASVLASYQRATRSEIKGWALGYQYDMSKRTQLYALLDRVDQRERHTLQSVVGMRHQF